MSNKQTRIYASESENTKQKGLPEYKINKTTNVKYIYYEIKEDEFNTHFIVHMK